MILLINGNPVEFEDVAPGQSATDAVLQEVHEERKSQDDKWGEQNHSPLEWLSILTEEVGEVARGINNAHFGGASYDNYREELIQVAAVAAAAVESLDRNGR